MNRLSDSTLLYLKKVQASVTGQKELRNGSSMVSVEFIVPNNCVELIYTEKDNYLKVVNILREAVRNNEIEKIDLEDIIDDVFEI